MHNDHHSPHKTAMLLLGLALLAFWAAAAPAAHGAEPAKRWVVVLHGGASSTARALAPADRASLERSLRDSICLGRDLLSNGGTALAAVEKVVVALENDPRFNAGRGAVFTRAGTHELDASIMDGATLRCGAVGGVKTLKNPVIAARLVMEKTPHVFLAADQADAFGTLHHCQQVSQDYFYTTRRFQQLNNWFEDEKLPPLTKPAYSLPPATPPADETSGDSGGHGTVGCVALDSHGNLAAATSTGGRTGKMPGRIGDTPIIGAGNYANNATCAVSGTGKGEEFIRHSICARMSFLIESQRLSLDEAARLCIFKVLKPEDGGLIAVDRQGNVATYTNTTAMPRAVADSTGRLETAIAVEP